MNKDNFYEVLNLFIYLLLNNDEMKHIQQMAVQRNETTIRGIKNIWTCFCQC